MSILDVLQPTESVPVGDTTQQVRGLTLEEIAAVVSKWPAVGVALNKWYGGEPIEDLTAMVALSPAVVSHVIATGCDHPGEAEWEKAASRLLVDQQVDLIVAIGRRTLPNGTGPIGEKLGKLLVDDGASSSTTGSPQSNGSTTSEAAETEIPSA